MKKKETTITIFTICAITFLIMGLINYQELRSLYLSAAIIMGGLSWWMIRALK